MGSHSCFCLWGTLDTIDRNNYAMSMTTSTTYPGGKAGDGVYQRIISQIPPHETYVEAFLGGGAIMRFKRPADRNIAVEKDADVLLAFDTPIPNLTKINANAIEWLKTYKFSGDEFVYLDPPYLMSTRKHKAPIYRHEMGDEASHRALLDVIKKLDVPVALSGYASDLYAQELKRWRSISFRVGTRGGAAIETLWMNYPYPTELHDYQYLGRDFTDRQRIKRKAERWQTKYSALPDLERQPIKMALMQVD